ncbi:unnamed protein product [Adineta ricciae]|nr:unnamed protein product [Adineta ricciae]
MASLEDQYGKELDILQKSYPSSQSLKRSSLLKMFERFGGEIEYIQQYLEQLGKPSDDAPSDPNETKEQQRARLRNKYTVQLAQLSNAGFNTKCPRVVNNLEKQHGDVNKVKEILLRQRAAKEKQAALNLKYKDQIAKLEADGVKTKNKQHLLKLLEKADGQIDRVKGLLAEKQHKKSSSDSEDDDDDDKVNEKSNDSSKKQYEFVADDLDHIKELRAAGIHGNPAKLLAIFHECNDSIELTVARIQKERQERQQEAEKRVQQRISLAQAHGAYININHRNDWPNDIEEVYLDGNNMMFVVDCLRQLCLNHARHKTERAIGQLAAAWNEQMRIPKVELIFDSTRQVDQIGSVNVTSAHPIYRTTDDMLIDSARRNDHHDKNKHTIIVTSDRDLAVQLSREGCQLVKSYAWFAHCAMILTPDLVAEDESSTEATTKSRKPRYNLDELVHRIAHIA